MKKVFIFLFLCLGFVGCATMPTQQEISNLDYGAPLTIDYQESIKKYFNDVLFDPYSAVYEFREPRLYWYKDIPLMGGAMYPGYLVSVKVNAKNRMGGYVGKHEYHFIFKNNQITKVLDDEYMLSRLHSR